MARPSALVIMALLGAGLGLAGCGLQPLYSGGGSGAVARGLGQVGVAPITGRNGWLMHDALATRLGGDRPASAARYRLDVRLDDRLESLGLLANSTISRERRTLRARYQLVDNATGAILLDATAGSDAGVDVASSEYATVAAEETALENLTHTVADQIIIRIAARLRAGADEQPAGK